MLMRAATVVQVLQDLLYVLLQLLVVAAIILSFVVSFIALFYLSLLPYISYSANLCPKAGHTTTANHITLHLEM